MTSPNTNIIHTCNGIGCSKQASQYCARCKSAHYCSSTCQKSEWPTHKLLCSSFAKLTEESRPSKNHFRTFNFPENGKPEAIWVLREVQDFGAEECCSDDDEDDEHDHHLCDNGKYPIPQREPFFKPGAFVRDYPIQKNPVLNHELKNTIVISHLDDFQAEQPNEGMEAIKAARPRNSFVWRNHLLSSAAMAIVATSFI